MTQEELAHVAEIDRSYLGTIERAEYSITVVTLGKLAAALRVPPATLLELPPAILFLPTLQRTVERSASRFRIAVVPRRFR